MRNRPRIARALLIGAVLAAGCAGCNDPAPAGNASPVELERRLALAAPTTTTPTDRRIVELQASAQNQPRKIDYWIALGQMWVRKARETTDPGYYKNAEACANVALDIQADAPLALDLRALVRLNDHRFADAEREVRRVLAAHKDDVQAWGILSDALLEQGDYEGAAEAAQHMVDLKPNLPSYSRAAHLRWLHGDVEGAKQIWRLAIDAGNDPRDPEPRAWAIVQAGTLFLNEGDIDGADAGFDLALQSMKDYAPALVGKARVLLARGDARRAAELLDRAFTASPLVETLWLLGDARRAAGDVAGAVEAFDRLMKIGRRTDPRTFALYLATSGRDPAEAVRIAEEESRTRGDLYTKDALAWALHCAGQSNAARPLIEAAISLGTRDPRLLAHAAAIKSAPVK